MRTTPLKAIFPKKLFKHLVVLAGLGNWLVNSINPPDKQEEVYLAWQNTTKF